MRRIPGMLLFVAIVFIAGAAASPHAADAAASESALYLELADGTVLAAGDGQVLQPRVVSGLGLEQDVISLRVQAPGVVSPSDVHVFMLQNDLVARARPSISTDYQPGDTTVAISGLDWTTHDSYCVAIATNYAVLFAEITASDLGVERILSVDDTYLPLQVELPFATNYAPQITLHYEWPGVGTVYGLRVHPGDLLPIGTYHLQLYDYHAESYSLLKPNFVLQSVEDVVSFRTADIAQVTATVTAPVTPIGFSSYQYPTNGPYRSMAMVSWNRLASGEYTTLVTKGSYDTFDTRVLLMDDAGKTWGYQVEHTVEIPADTEMDINLRQLTTVFNAPPNTMTAGRDLYLPLLVTVQDQFGRECEIYQMDGFLQQDSPRTLLFYGLADPTNPVATAAVNGRYVTIPEHLSGQYAVSLMVDTGPVPLVAAIGTVSVLGNSTQISCPVSLPDELLVSSEIVVKVTAIGWNCPSIVQELTLSDSVRTANLIIPNASGNTYRVKYEIVSGGINLVPWGYLGYDNRIGFSEEQARLIYQGVEAHLPIPAVKAAQDPICFRLSGQQLGAPSATVSYLEQSERGDHYRSLSQADLLPHIEPLAEGWLIGFPGLSFERHSQYQVGISTGNALFAYTLTPADVGSQVDLVIDHQAYPPLHIAAPFSIAEATQYRLELYRKDAQGVVWPVGSVQPDAHVPAGEYAFVQLTATTELGAYNLQQQDIAITSAQSTLTFAADQMAKLSIAVPAGLTLGSVFSRGTLAGTPVAVAVSWVKSGAAAAAYLSKGNCRDLRVSLWVNTQKFELVHQGQIDADLDFGTLSLREVADLHTSEFEADGMLSVMDGFRLVDSAGRTCTISDLGKPVEGGVVLTDAAAHQVYLPFVNGLVRLPGAPGDYTLSYQMPDTLLIPVAGHPPVVIRLFDFPPSLDVNDDDCLNVLDLAALALNYGTRLVDGSLDNPMLDFTGDGVIDLYDLVWMARSMNLGSQPA